MRREAMKRTVLEILTAVGLWLLLVAVTCVLFVLCFRVVEVIRADRVLSLVCLAIPLIGSGIAVLRWIVQRYRQHLLHARLDRQYKERWQ